VTEPLRISFEVRCPPEAAFALWTERTSLWWPASHTVTADPDLDVVIEPRPGGRIFERTPIGDEHEWGRVLAWEPPRRLTYTWHLRQDAADATEVEVTFAAADGAGTHVSIEHRGWEALGARGPDGREANQRGWSSLLPHFQRAADRA
jgi:uncharacterized protein YndB with AHSA1/START domain